MICRNPNRLIGLCSPAGRHQPPSREPCCEAATLAESTAKRDGHWPCESTARLPDLHRAKRPGCETSAATRPVGVFSFPKPLIRRESGWGEDSGEAEGNDTRRRHSTFLPYPIHRFASPLHRQRGLPRPPGEKGPRQLRPGADTPQPPLLKMDRQGRAAAGSSSQRLGNPTTDLPPRCSSSFDCRNAQKAVDHAVVALADNGDAGRLEAIGIALGFIA